MNPPVFGQRSLLGGAVSPAFASSSSSSSGWHLELQQHHLGFLQEAPAVVDPHVEPPLLDHHTGPRRALHPGLWGGGGSFIH